MGTPFDDVQRVQWSVDDGQVNTCDFRIINGIKYVPERTCKNLTDFVDGNFDCSVCGGDGGFMYDDDFIRINYCPNCGARVVGD